MTAQRVYFAVKHLLKLKIGVFEKKILSTILGPKKEKDLVRRPVEGSLNKVLKSDFVDGKRARGRPKNSWKEAIDRDSIAFDIGNWKTNGSRRS